MFHRAEEAALNRSSCRQFADGMQDLARRNDSPRTGGQAGHEAALTAIKAVHTLAWFSIESCMSMCSTQDSPGGPAGGPLSRQASSQARA